MYPAALLLSLVAALGLRGRRPFVRDWSLLALAAAVSLDWAVLTCIYRLSGLPNDWRLNAGVDYGTATLVLVLLPPGRLRALILASYAVELVFHGIFALGRQDALATWDYYWQLSYTAWVQTGALIIAGGGGGLLRGRRQSRRLGRRPAQLPLLHGGVRARADGDLRVDTEATAGSGTRPGQ
jgi:hypothetical protein